MFLQVEELLEQELEGWGGEVGLVEEVRVCAEGEQGGGVHVETVQVGGV